MKVNEARTFALAAAAAALLLAVSAGARQQGTAKHEGHDAAEKVPSASSQAKGKYMTIVGEVMDPACFLEAGAKSIGPGHYQCALDCARSGQTLAIYARDEDRIYFIAGELPGRNPNDPLLPYIHKKVDVSGTVYHRSDAYGIVITKVALHEDKAGSEKAGAAGEKKAGTAGEKKAGAPGENKAGAGAPAGK